MSKPNREALAKWLYERWQRFNDLATSWEVIDRTRFYAEADALLADVDLWQPEPEAAAPTDAAFVDLYWETSGDNWAIPDWLMAKFGRAVLREWGQPAPEADRDALIEMLADHIEAAQHPHHRSEVGPDALDEHYLATVAVDALLASGFRPAPRTVSEALDRYDHSVSLGYVPTGHESALAAELRAASAPRTVSTVEELEALPNNSLIRDSMGDHGIVFGDRVVYPETKPLLTEYVAKHYLPATVLFVPSVGVES